MDLIPIQVSCEQAFAFAKSSTALTALQRTLRCAGLGCKSRRLIVTVEVTLSGRNLNFVLVEGIDISVLG